jgi:hypothetical protein
LAVLQDFQKHGIEYYYRKFSKTGNQMSLDSDNLPNQEPEVIKINEQPKGFFVSVLWFQKFDECFQKIPKWKTP